MPGPGSGSTGPGRRSRTENVYINLGLQPLAALIAGILILIVPRLLNYIVAVYLIVVGFLGLMAR